MDYTTGDQYVVHEGTGHRMAQDSEAIPTEWPAEESNQIVWSLMEVINEAITLEPENSALTPAAFDPDIPATYRVLYEAIQTIIASNIPAVPTVEKDRIFIENATFAAAVEDGDAVYWDSGNSRFDQAIADGTAAQKMVGFADVTSGEVTLSGNLDIMTGLTPGSYYLSGDTAGAITQTAPANLVPVGYAKSATTIFIDTENIPTASDTQKGIAERATPAEVQAGTDEERFVTPAGLASYSKLHASSGYQALPGGLIVQWVYGVAANGDLITFPITFPTAAYSLQVTDKNIDTIATTAHIVGYDALTTSGFILSAFTHDGASVSQTGYFAFAIGK